MEEIIRFVSLAQTDRFTITELCEQFNRQPEDGLQAFGALPARRADAAHGAREDSHPADDRRQPPRFAKHASMAARHGFEP